MSKINMNKEAIQKQWRMFNKVFWISWAVALALSIIAALISHPEWHNIIQLLFGLAIGFLMAVFGYRFTLKKVSLLLFFLGFPWYVLSFIGWAGLWYLKDKMIKDANV